MSLLEAAELTAMRDVLDQSLPDTAIVVRSTLTPDAYGGQTQTLTTVATVPCRVSPTGARGSDSTIGGVVASLSAWTITLPSETDVNVSDRITVGARSFEVTEVAARSWEISRRVYCDEVTA